MCLINPRTTTTKKRTGYVWMMKNNNGRLISILGYNKEYDIGIEYKARDEFDPYTMVKIRGYTPGFHIFLTRKDAIQFACNNNWDFQYFLVKVKFREPIVEGYAEDWRYRIHITPAIVAKYRTIIKEEIILKRKESVLNED